MVRYPRRARNQSERAGSIITKMNTQDDEQVLRDVDEDVDCLLMKVCRGKMREMIRSYTIQAAEFQFSDNASQDIEHAFLCPYQRIQDIDA